jgi:hypothetical protein
MVCGFSPILTKKSNLQAYITQRYDEILHELEQDYIRMCDPFRVENQYFNKSLAIPVISDGLLFVWHVKPFAM